MKRFLVIYRASAEANQAMSAMSSEAMRKGMEAWMQWSQRCGSGLVDMGTPLGNGRKVTATGSQPANGEVVGYSVLQAEDMEGAKKMLADHPHLSMPGSCEIEVHECLPLPQ